MALSCELLACAILRMLVVCMTSTEKLGSQLAMRDPEGERVEINISHDALTTKSLFVLEVIKNKNNIFGVSNNQFCYIFFDFHIHVLIYDLLCC